MAITQMKGPKSKERNQYVDHNRKQQQRDHSSSSDTDKRTGNKQLPRIRSREPQLSAPGFADPEASRRERISCHRIHHNSRRNGGSSFFIYQQPTGHTHRQLQCRCGYPNRDWREQQVHWKNWQQQQVSDKKRTLELGEVVRRHHHHHQLQQQHQPDLVAADDRVPRRATIGASGSAAATIPSHEQQSHHHPAAAARSQQDYLKWPSLEQSQTRTQTHIQQSSSRYGVLVSFPSTTDAVATATSSHKNVYHRSHYAGSNKEDETCCKEKLGSWLKAAAGKQVEQFDKNRFFWEDQKWPTLCESSKYKKRLAHKLIVGDLEEDQSCQQGFHHGNNPPSQQLLAHERKLNNKHNSAGVNSDDLQDASTTCTVVSENLGLIPAVKKQEEQAVPAECIGETNVVKDFSGIANRRWCKGKRLDTGQELTGLAEPVLVMLNSDFIITSPVKENLLLTIALTQKRGGSQQALDDEDDDNNDDDGTGSLQPGADQQQNHELHHKVADVSIHQVLVGQFIALSSFLGFELGQDALRVRCESNAGGTSTISESLSVEYFARRFQAKDVVTEMEVEYCSMNWKKVDYICTLYGQRVGVSVTRAMSYPDPDAFSPQAAYRLLHKKLFGLVVARHGVIKQHSFLQSILHVWCETQRTANIMEAEYRGVLEELDISDDVIMVLTVAEGHHARPIFYEHCINNIWTLNLASKAA